MAPSYPRVPARDLVSPEAVHGRPAGRSSSTGGGGDGLGTENGTGTRATLGAGG
jgi:hypothetical protein